MVAPVVLGALAFVVLPLVMVVWYSLHEWNVLANTFTFAGADNYERMASDDGLADALLASLWFSIGLVVLNIALALLLAVLLNQRLPGTTTFRTFFFSPVVVSLVAWTIVWSFLLQADGGINGFLAVLGIDGPNWLRGDFTAMMQVTTPRTTWTTWPRTPTPRRARSTSRPPPSASGSRRPPPPAPDRPPPGRRPLRDRPRLRLRAVPRQPWSTSSRVRPPTILATSHSPALTGP